MQEPLALQLLVLHMLHLFTATQSLTPDRKQPALAPRSDGPPSSVQLERHWLADIDAAAKDLTGATASYFFRPATDPTTADTWLVVVPSCNPCSEILNGSATCPPVGAAGHVDVEEKLACYGCYKVHQIKNTTTAWLQRETSLKPRHLSGGLPYWMAAEQNAHVAIQ